MTELCTGEQAARRIKTNANRKGRRVPDPDRCGSAVLCRCNVLSCCACTYVRAIGACSPVAAPRPCR